jgi:hypothetical protein
MLVHEHEWAEMAVKKCCIATYLVHNILLLKKIFTKKSDTQSIFNLPAHNYESEKVTKFECQ